MKILAGELLEELFSSLTPKLSEGGCRQPDSTTALACQQATRLSPGDIVYAHGKAHSSI
jgi:hypothetical protein